MELLGISKLILPHSVTARLLVFTATVVVMLLILQATTELGKEAWE